ncbi:autotransporter outer membrane beta-barrel domain-containing protein [Phyllobacterium endophyticum]|uniref:autotransporter outer membrane beta-barrel domain-containing protein n=1 Tax=Phyllobacterium endophyticum TaxID=1149773 RepID=UPI0011C892A7|nr:autotransporter outer membrane beta-barrel domain-containing protein [Phyllobacterium endophyticum]TXR49558.1 autotransporter outer membrane beta-barrel domain-containing protein [Phyllobacterium endophyticum]
MSTRNNSRQSGPKAQERQVPTTHPLKPDFVRGGRMTKWKGQAASFAPHVAQLVSATARRLLPAALLVGLGAGSAAAADFYWDGGIVNGGNPGPNAEGGAGTWNTTLTNWDTAAGGGASTAWVSGNNNAFFTGGSSVVTKTVTLGEAITAHSIQIGVNAYIITGSTITLTGPGAFISAGSGTGASVNSNLIGTNGLIKAGSGTIALGGMNTGLTGGININNGILRLDGVNSAGNNAITVAGGAALSVNNSNAFGGNTDAARVLLADGSAFVVSGTLNHNITLTQAGTFGFGGNGTWTGNIIMNGDATLRVNDGLTLNSAIADNNGWVTSVEVVAGGSNVAFNGNLSFSGGLTVADRALLASVNNTYSGDTVVASNAGLIGALTYANAGAISANSKVIIGDADSIGLIGFGYSPASITLGTGVGQFQFAGDGGFISRPGSVDVTLTLNGGAGLTWGAGNFIGDGDTLHLGSNIGGGNARALTLTNNIDLGTQQRTIFARLGDIDDHAVMGGVLSGTGGLQVIGDGALELTGANTYTGATEVQSTLVLGSANAIAGGIGVSGGDPSQQSNLQLNGITGNYLSDGIVVLTAASGDFLRSLGTAGNQVQWLNDGGFTAVGGVRTVNIGNGAALTWGAGGFVGDGERLVFGGGYGNSAINFQNAIDLGSQNRVIEVNNITTGLVGLNLNGVISGSGGLVLDGTGDVALTGANSFTGNAVLGSSGATDMEVTVTTIGNAGVAGNLGAGSTIELRSADNGVLSYTGAGESTNRNWLIGVVNGGNTNIQNNGSGALQLTGNITKDGGGAGNRLALQGTFASSDNNGDGIADDANVISGVISETSGTLAIELSGSAGNVWRFTGDNTYSGSTTIHAGRILEVDDLANGGQASSIGDSSNVATNLNIVGTLRYIGTGDSTDRLMLVHGPTQIESSGTGALQFTNSGLVVRGTGAGGYNITFGGTNTDENVFAPTLTNLEPTLDHLSINLGITKNGPGLWALATNNNAQAHAYTGNTTITGGALKLNHAGAITGGLGATSNHGAAGSSQRSSMILFNGTATTGGVIGLTAASGSFTRGLTLEADSFLTNGTTPNVEDDDSYVQGVRWAGSGGFAAWDGTQVVNLGGAGAQVTWNVGGFVTNNNALIFGYETANGTVDFQNGVNLTNAARTVRTNNGTAAVDAVMNGVITGTTAAGALVKDGAGTLALTAANTYTGVTTINAGTLQIGNGGTTGTLGAGNVTVAAGANIAFNRSNTYTVTNQITGAGGLIQSGTGTTILTAALNQVGATTISAGTLQVNNVLETPTVAMTGTSTMTVAGTVGAAAGGTSTFTGDAGVATINVNAGGTLRATGDLGDGSDLVNLDGTLNTGAGTLNLGLGNDTFALNDGAVLVGLVDGGTGGESGNGDALRVTTTAGRTLDAVTSSLANFESLNKQGAGTLTLTGSHSYSANTTIQGGTLLVNGGLATATVNMAAATVLTINGTAGGMAGGTAVFTGDAGVNTINVNSGAALRATGDLGDGSDVVNLTGTLDTGAGVFGFGSGNDTFTLNDGAVLTGIADGGVGTDVLQVVNTVDRTLDGVNVTSFESLNKQGSGTLTLTGAHSYSSGTTIQAGTLQVGNGAIAGALTTPTVANSGSLVFNLNTGYTFNGVISGTGSARKIGTGVTTLTGTNSYAGGTDVFGGTLIVNGNQSGATGDTTVSLAATLGGTGTIGGDVTVGGNGRLSPGDVGNAAGTLTINGNLSLLPASHLDFNFGQANGAGGPLNDLLVVGGNLTLNGTIHVTQSPGGTLGPGVYRVINYGGTLTNNILNVTDPNYVVQTSVANQVNLINSAGLQLSYWDGDVGPHSNSIVNGGSGTWRAAGDQNWTDSTGLFAAPFDNASFAIFQGAAGTVTVDNTNGQVGVAGMQFATNGYVVQGGDIALVNAQSTIRVGDGSAASAGYTATISSNLTGTGQLVKTDAGTLILTGVNNTYGGGTAINGGTVQIDADGKLGAIAGVLSLDGGTLHTTANVVAARSVVLDAGGGTFETDGATSLVLGNTIDGVGALTKEGGGTLVLAGTNSYQGGTLINDGTVQITADANLGFGNVTFDGGTLRQSGPSIVTARTATLAAGGGTFQTDSGLQWNGTVDGAGALTKTGPGTLFLGADNTYSGGTTIAGGQLTLGTGGTTGSILGDVVNNGTLSFNRSNLYTFDGTISGIGGVSQDGTGNTVLTADNAYAGNTLIAGSGGLYIDGNQTAATGLTNVNLGTLGGSGIIGGDVFVGGGGRLAPGGIGATPGMLTINGNLDLADGSNLDYSFGQAGVVGGAYNDLTVVHGDLTLDGTINVTEAPGGNFGPGIYRVISYDGALTDNVLDTTSPNHLVQTSVAHQVNLINISGQTLNFWDGNAGPKSNDIVDGGDGTWRAAGDDNWTGPDGSLNAAFSNGSFAIFAGTSGLVTVDNTNGQVQAAGMQFATSGYVVQGQLIQLIGPQSTIRVGDGTLSGAGYIATIGSVLQGSSQLVKTDLGTLVLAGTNSYTGSTAIKGGTLQVSADANLGNAAGGLNLDDGATLQTTAAFTSARDVTFTSGTGTVQTDADLTFSGLLGGAGGLTKTGTSALTLTGANSYTGPTTVSAGSLFVNGDQSGVTGLTSVQSSATLGGSGTIGGDVVVADGATLSPGSANGTPGTLAISGNLALSSGSILNYSFGEANIPGGTLNDLTTVGGNLVLDGTLNVSVSTGGTFGPGVYRVFSYNGALTNNGLSVGSIPSTNYFVQTAIANQVNLVNAQGLSLNYWDGAAGPKFDGVVNGGDGVWQNASGNDNWADATGIINASFSDGSFAIFAGAAGMVTVDNGPGQVTASGMQFTADGYLIQGGSIALDGGATSTIRVGDGTSPGADITATIASQLSGNTQLVKTDLGTLVLTGTNSYSGGTAINGGALQVSADANLGDTAGVLSFNGGTLHTTASFSSRRNIDLLGQGTFLTDDATTLTLDGTLSGSGSFVKSGTGKMVLASDGAGFAGATTIDDGTLAVNGSLCGEVNVRSGGRLQGTGTVCDTNNFDGGTVAPGNSIGILTVAGDYAGSGGTLEIETVLGGDASPTDRLVVTGNTAGTTRVRVINLDGGGAQTQNGIEIVDVGGASNGSFSLAGDYVFDGEQAVVGGAYAYRLYKNGISTPNDGDWYLRSTYLSPDNPAPQPLYAPGLPLYEAYAGVLQSFNELGTLQQRVGNRSWGEGATPQGADVPGQGPVDGKAIWARIQAAHSQLDPDVSTTAADYDVSTWRLQAGLDGLLHEDRAGMLIGGLTVHYGTVSADVSSLFGNGSIDATGYGFGGTLTWYGNNGLYVDAQAEATWYDSDIRSATLGSTLANGNDGFGYALSIEAGQKIALDGNWSLTPQAQLAYSAVDFDNFTDPYGAGVALGNSDILIGRLGLSVDYESQWANAAGQASRSHVYGIANLYYDFLDGSDVNVSGVSLVSQNQALWGGLGLGGSISWADSRYTLYGEAIARGSFEDMSDNNAISAKVGFSVNW